MSVIDPGGGGGPIGGPIFPPGTPGSPSTPGGGTDPINTGSNIVTPGNARALGLYWKNQVSHAERAFDAWIKRGDNVIRRYRDERGMEEPNSRFPRKFNVLWSNIQVLSPSLYGRAPKPEVSRRYRDSDPVGRLASTIVERSLQYECEQFPDFNAAMEGVVEDRLLPGRGIAWLTFIDFAQGESDIVHSRVDYVFWKDFLHAPARTWDEVWWVARRVYLTREQGEARFGSAFNAVPLREYNQESTLAKRDQLNESFAEKGLVYEIWDKTKKTVCWYAEGLADALDEKPDPLELEGFFPCPKPLYATMTNGTMVPIPDFALYQDQAIELDSLTTRISFLVMAIKAVGIYDSQFPEIGRLLNNGSDNSMIAVKNYAALAEKGGLKGGVELLDLTTQLQALGALYAAREQVKQTIYEICGISDIIRGSSKAEETLGAQQYKVQFGSLRMRTSQTDVARFASDIFRLKAQIMCKEYPPELLIKMSGILNTSEAQNPDPQVVAQYQQNVIAALQLIRESTSRDFRIAIESDTLAQIDEQEEHAKAAEMLTSVGGLMQQALPALQVAPELLPMTSEIIKDTLRRYHSGRALEAATDQSFNLLAQRLIKSAQNPPPSEAEIQAKTQAQSDQMRAQVDTQAAQQKAQFDMQVQQGKLQQEMQLETLKSNQAQELAKMELQFKAAVEQLKDSTERYKAQLSSDTAIAVANIGAASKAQSDEKQLEGTKITKGPITDPEISSRLAAIEEFTKRPPRKKVIVRDGEDRITAIQEVEGD